MSPAGLGGYILFGSDRGLYRLNTKTDKFSKIIDDELLDDSSAQVYDISSDEKYIAGTAWRDNSVKIEIRNLQDNSVIKSFSCPDIKYGQQGGNVYFFDNDRKLVYEMAVGNPDNEEFAMFTVDIESGQQKMVASDETGGGAYGRAAEWALRHQ